MLETSTRMDGGRVLLGGALVSLVGFLILTALVSRQYLDGADRLDRTLVQQSHQRLLRPVMEGVSFLGGHPGQITVVVLGVAALWRGRRRWALSLPIVMAGAGLIQLLGKWAIDRPRPNLEPWGFPSAHVLTLVVLFGYFAYVIGLCNVHRGWRCLAIGLCAATVGAVAYSRIYLDAHWLSDVLGGVSGGLAYLLVVIWLIRSIPGPREPPVLRAAFVGERMEGVPVDGTTGPATAEPLSDHDGRRRDGCDACVPAVSERQSKARAQVASQTA